MLQDAENSSRYCVGSQQSATKLLFTCKTDADTTKDGANNVKFWLFFRATIVFVLKAKSEKTKIAWPKNERPKTSQHELRFENCTDSRNKLLCQNVAKFRRHPNPLRGAGRIGAASQRPRAAGLLPRGSPARRRVVCRFSNALRLKFPGLHPYQQEDLFLTH